MAVTVRQNALRLGIAGARGESVADIARRTGVADVTATDAEAMRDAVVDAINNGEAIVPGVEGGALALSSPSEAEMGTKNDVLMTPLRTKQAIAALAPGIKVAELYGSTGPDLVEALLAHDGDVYAPTGVTLEVPASDGLIVTRNLNRIWADGAGSAKVVIGPGDIEATDGGPLGVIGSAAQKVILEGAEPVTAELLGVHARAGSSGAWDVTLNLSDVTGISEGQTLIIRDAEPFPHLSGDESVFRVRVGVGELLNMSAAAGNVTATADTMVWASVDETLAPDGLEDIVSIGDLAHLPGQSRHISALNNATRTATVNDDWDVEAAGSRAYYISRPSTGTIGTGGVASTTVTGVGTAFQDEGNPGGLVIAAGIIFGVESITDQDTLVADRPVNIPAGSKFTLLNVALPHNGRHEVLSVDAVNNRVTVRNKYRGPHPPPLKGITGGKVSVLQTRFIQTIADGHGFISEQDGAAQRIDRIELLGPGAGFGLAMNGASLEGHTQKGIISTILLGDDVSISNWTFCVFIGSGCDLQSRKTVFADAASITIWAMEYGGANLRKAIVANSLGRGIVGNKNATLLVTEAQVIAPASDAYYLEGAECYGEIPWIWAPGGMGVRGQGAATFHGNEGMIAWAGVHAIYGEMADLSIDRMILVAAESAALSVTKLGRISAEQTWASACLDGFVITGVNDAHMPGAASISHQDQGLVGIDRCRIVAPGAIFRGSGSVDVQIVKATADLGAGGWADKILVGAQGTVDIEDAAIEPSVITGVPGRNLYGPEGGIVTDGAAPPTAGEVVQTISVTGLVADVEVGPHVTLVEVVAGAGAKIPGFSGDHTKRTRPLIIQEAGGSAPLVLLNEGSGVSGNRVLAPNGLNIYLPPIGAVMLRYDQETQRFQPMTAVRSVTPAFKAALSADQVVSTTGSWVTLAFNTDVFDAASDFDTATHVFTARVAGIYQFTAAVTITSDGSPPATLRVGFAKNGTPVNTSIDRESRVDFGSHRVTDLMELAAGDTVKAQVWLDTNDSPVEADNSFFAGFLVQAT